MVDNINKTAAPSGAKGVAIQLITFICIVAVSGMIIPAVWKLIAGKDGGTNAMILTSAVYSVLVLFVFVRKKWCVLSPAYFQSKPWCVLFWSCLVGVGAIIPESALDEIMPKLPDLVGESMTDIINNDYGYFTICIFAPLVEEVVMRGAILRTLLNSMKSRWGAIAISALLFALIHMNPAQMPYAFIAGLFLGWIYSRTGSVLPGIAYHWVNNTIVFVVARMMPQFADSNLIEIFGGDHKRVGLAIIFSLFILLPSIYQLAVRTKQDRA